MFTDDEDWDSTENQDSFIKEYFYKSKVLSKKGSNVPKAAKEFKNSAQDSISSSKKKSENHHDKVAVISNPISNKHSINTDSERSRKKMKKLSTLSQDHCDINYDSNSDTEMKNSDISECTGKKSKKKRKKSKNYDGIAFEEPALCDNMARQINAGNFDSSEVETTHTAILSDSSDFKSKKSKRKRKKSKMNNAITLEEQSSFDETTEQINTENSDSLENENTSEAGLVPHSSSTNKSTSNQSKFHQKLQAAKFRYLNEMLYTNKGKEALSYFQENTDEFQDYHTGYQSQVSKWPINPVDIIIQQIRQMDKHVVIADLGCGEAKIAEAFPKRKVHSFDLIPLKECITACDISKVPLPNNSVDVAVFCLSLMGTNWKDYIIEGHRILKLGAMLMIAEIESRIEDFELFIKNIEKYGFSIESKNLSHKMFIFLNFKKINKKKKNKVPDITLKPCLYKKR